MIKFFRTIRKKLLAEGKTANYLKYAIGEIVLVVIGILIALQINNWNSHRLQQIKERGILIEMMNNLQVNLNAIKYTIDNHKDRISEIDILIEHFLLKKPFTDSISNEIRGIRYPEEITLVTTSFEELKSLGFDILSSEKLKRLTVQLFNSEYPALIEWTKGISVVHYEALSTPFFLKYFYEDNTGKLKITNYDELLENQQFINMLSSRKTFKIAFLGRVQEVQENTMFLLNKIREELEYSY